MLHIQNFKIHAFEFNAKQAEFMQSPCFSMNEFPENRCLWHWNFLIQVCGFFPDAAECGKIYLK